MKRIPVLATLLTLCNGICGFAAIAYASKITLDGSLSDGQIADYFLLSAALIFVAMIFDVLDGYAARMSRTASQFGAQLDSLCDAISFGAAPAFLLLRLGQEWQDQPVIAKSVAIIAGLYLACAVLRLARFNIETTPDPASHKRFKGLPSPAAAGCVVSVAVLRADLGLGWSGLDPQVLQGFVRVWAPMGALVAALLMVSRFSYPHIGRQLIRGRRQFQFIVQLVLVLAIMALTPHLAFFVIFWSYALLGPVRSLGSQKNRGTVAEQTPGLD